MAATLRPENAISTSNVIALIRVRADRVGPGLADVSRGTRPAPDHATVSVDHSAPGQARLRSCTQTKDFSWPRPDDQNVFPSGLSGR